MFLFRIFILGLFIISAAQVLGQSKTYVLKKNETISELLYKRLKITPIYNGFLKKVLIFNQMDEESAKKLRPGQIVILPDDVSVTENKSPEVTPNEVTNELTYQLLWTNKTYFGFFGTYSYLNGGGTNDSSPSFSSHLIRPDLSLRRTHENSKLLFLGEAKVGYQSVASDSEQISGNNIWLAGALVRGLWKADQTFRLGFDVAWSQNLFILPANSEQYKILKPWILATGPRFEVGEKNILGLSVSLKPAQAITGSVKLERTFNIGADLDLALFGNNRLIISSTYMDQKNELYPSALWETRVGFLFLFE